MLSCQAHPQGLRFAHRLRRLWPLTAAWQLSKWFSCHFDEIGAREGKDLDPKALM
jgi:hypothetical protein